MMRGGREKGRRMMEGGGGGGGCGVVGGCKCGDATLGARGLEAVA